MLLTLHTFDFKLNVMRLHRFYIENPIEKKIVIYDKELLHQWVKVFRFKVGDKIIIFNGDGSEYEYFFELITKNEAIIILEKELGGSTSKLVGTELHIFQSIIKKDNFEFVVEKCTEIGVSGFYPIISERSEKKNLNIERLNKIAKEASEQSGKIKLPKIFDVENLEKAIENFDGKLFCLDFDGEDFKKIIDLSKNNPSQIKNTFDGAGKIGILIGPEGGWTDNEREFFKQKNIKSISFGSQILRAETASIVSSALILF